MEGKFGRRFLSESTKKRTKHRQLIVKLRQRVSSVTSALRKSAETPDSGVSSQMATQTLRILIKIIKNSVIRELFNILM